MEKAKIPSDVKNEWGFDETVYQSSCGAVTKAHRTVHPLWGKILKQLKKENLLHDPFFDYCRTNDLKGDRVLSQVLKARDPHSELLSFFQTNHPPSRINKHVDKETLAKLYHTACTTTTSLLDGTG